MNLLIVDDERIILNGVANPNNWKSLEIENIFTADNAFDAFKIVESEKIDIVISDINMPKKDGLELCSDIIEKYPDTYLILLSGYDYFEYAQKAMRIGVNEYLLKPATIEKIREAVKKAIEFIKVREAKKKRVVELENVFEDSIIHLREKWINSRIENAEISKEEAINNIRLYGINLDVYNNSMAVIAIKNLDNNITWKKDDIFLVQFALLNIVSEILDGYNIKFVSNYDKHHNLLIIYEKQEEQNPDWIEEVSDIVAKNIDIDLEIGYSENCSFTNLKTAYDEACKNMLIRDTDEKTSEEQNAVIQNTWMHSYKLEDDIVMSVRTGNLEKTEEHINSLFEYFDEINDLTYLKGVCLGMAFVVFQRMSAEGSEYDSEDDRKNVLASIRNADSWEKLKEIIVNSFCELANDKNMEYKARTKDVIAIAKQYAIDHISEDISLQAVASRVYMNPNYFSNLFKKKTGISFSEYIIDKKIELAREWLLNDEMLVYDVAQKLGFNDQRYFSSFFKKRTGMTPTQYREENRKEK